MAKDNDLQNLFHDTLKDIYFAEKKILAPCRRWRRRRSRRAEGRLRKARGRDRGSGRDGSNRSSTSIGEKPRARPALRSSASSTKAQEIMEEYKGSPALDAGLLAAAQAVEHYEISRYGTLRDLGERTRTGRRGRLLEATLSEEKQTDADLTTIAESEVNQHAEAA